MTMFSGFSPHDVFLSFGTHELGSFAVYYISGSVRMFFILGSALMRVKQGSCSDAHMLLSAILHYFGEYESPISKLLDSFFKFGLEVDSIEVFWRPQVLLPRVPLVGTTTMGTASR